MTTSTSTSTSSAAPSGGVLARSVPAALASPAAVPAAAGPARVGPMDRCGVEEILAGLPGLLTWPDWGVERRGQTLLGSATILGWLTGFAGDGWQQRWLHAGADAGKAWFDEVGVPGRTTGAAREILRDGLAGLLLGRVVLPSYEFLTAYSAYKLFQMTDGRLVASKSKR